MAGFGTPFASARPASTARRRGPQVLAFLALALALGLAFAPLASAQSLTVNSFTQTPTEYTITIRNSSTANRFLLQSSPDLSPGSWTTLTATFSPVAGQPGVFRSTFNRSLVNRVFYRVLGFTGTAEDRDGDGLPDTLEALVTINTDGDVWDTDGDDFSDGVEFAAGTDPLDPLSRPNFGLPPRVEFTDVNIEGTEGSPTLLQLTLDRPFFGTVTYSVNTRSTAAPGIDYQPLSGSVTVNGSAATIPITWVDDLEVQPVRLLFIQLTPTPGQNYIPGGRDVATVRVMDNDAWWSGVLTGLPDDGINAPTHLLRNFRVKLAASGATRTAVFAAGAGQDGLPLLTGTPAGEAGSQSSGLIPPGVWPGTVTAFDTQTFAVSTPAIPLPQAPDVGVGAGGSLFGPVADQMLTLSLHVAPGAYAWGEISPNRIAGGWQENVSSVSAPYLNHSASGMFLLQRDLPTLKPVPVEPLVP